MDFAPWGAKSDARYLTRQWLEGFCFCREWGGESLLSVGLKEQKKKPVHRRTDPSGSFPLAGVLVSVVYVPAEKPYSVCADMLVSRYHIRENLSSGNASFRRDSIILDNFKKRIPCFTSCHMGITGIYILKIHYLPQTKTVDEPLPPFLPMAIA